MIWGWLFSTCSYPTRSSLLPSQSFLCPRRLSPMTYSTKFLCPLIFHWSLPVRSTSRRWEDGGGGDGEWSGRPFSLPHSCLNAVLAVAALPFRIPLGGPSSRVPSSHIRDFWEFHCRPCPLFPRELIASYGCPWVFRYSFLASSSLLCKWALH